MASKRHQDESGSASADNHGSREPLASPAQVPGRRALKGRFAGSALIDTLASERARDQERDALLLTGGPELLMDGANWKVEDLR